MFGRDTANYRRVFPLAVTNRKFGQIEDPAASCRECAACAAHNCVIRIFKSKVTVPYSNVDGGVTTILPLNVFRKGGEI
jgi:hypothetical protein